MKHRMKILGIVATIGLTIAACGSISTSDTAAAPATLAGSATTAAAVAQLPQGSEPVQLNPADFSTEINNPYWPMTPGSQWTYVEIDGEGNEQRVVVTVTTETKEIANGITALVVRDTVTLNGELIEDTFDWYAQDASGAIWYLGEDTAEFENGETVSTGGSFEAGWTEPFPASSCPPSPPMG